MTGGMLWWDSVVIGGAESAKKGTGVIVENIVQYGERRFQRHSIVQIS